MKKVVNNISKAISKWQNVFAVAAIVAIAVLHFVIQSNFIQSEQSKNLLVEEVSVKTNRIRLPNFETEQLRPQIAEIKENTVETKKTNKVISNQPAPQIKQRQIEKTEIVLPKPQPQIKKKEVVDPRTERLRRAERILTGI